MLSQRVPMAALLIVFAVSAARGQGLAVTAQQAAPFMGTWWLPNDSGCSDNRAFVLMTSRCLKTLFN
jgi:hypothetical protein